MKFVNIHFCVSVCVYVHTCVCVSVHACVCVCLKQSECAVCGMHPVCDWTVFLYATQSILLDCVCV